MVYIVNTHSSYEAGVALCNKALKELNKGVEYDIEDIRFLEDLTENVYLENQKIHREVTDRENRRYGGNKAVCENLKEIVDRLLDAERNKPKEPDFEAMSKDELIQYIKSMKEAEALKAEESKEEEPKNGEPAKKPKREWLPKEEWEKLKRERAQKRASEANLEAPEEPKEFILKDPEPEAEKVS